MTSSPNISGNLGWGPWNIRFPTTGTWQKVVFNFMGQGVIGGEDTSGVFIGWWWRGVVSSFCLATPMCAGTRDKESVLFIGKLLPVMWFAVPPTDGTATQLSSRVFCVREHPNNGS